MKIGIDIGGSHISSGIIDENGKILDKEERNIKLSDADEEKRSQNIIIEAIHDEIKALLSRNNFKISDIKKIGISAPGSPTKTSITNLKNLHIKSFDISKVLNEEYCAEITIRNDGKCAGLAEKEYGALKGYQDAVFLCIGTGVGSAVFLDGKLLIPKQNPGFELGHMIIDKNGEKCNCGKNGCFETYASMKRLKEKAHNKFQTPEDISTQELQKYIENNKENKEVSDFFNEYLENVAIGISNIINIFEPEAICFGGSFSYYDDIFLEKLNEKTKKYLFNENTRVKFFSAILKNDAGMIGATL